MFRRSKRLLAFLLCFGTAAMGSCSTPQAKCASIKVDPANASTTNGGVFEGWGTSLCWWANRLGYSDVLAQKSADLFYGSDGLRLNIMRYNIGGGDDPTHRHITRTDSAVPGWLRWDEAQQKYVYDYDADHNQLNVMRRAVEASGKDAVVEVFSNSPPYFMTVSGCSSGGEDPNANNLRDDCYDDFAAYLVHVTDYIQKELGIKVTSLSPMNEPNTNYWRFLSEKQEGCHFDAGDPQNRIILAVSEEMKKQGVTDVIIAASDETSPEKQLEEYQRFTPDVRAALGRINTHSYIENKIHEMGQLAKDEGFNLWMSEVGGDGTAGDKAGDMAPALWFGKKIISDMNALSPSAWVMWQVVDNHVSAEGYNGNRDSGMVDMSRGFWGVAVADHDNNEIILSQKYYGMGQFTRYIRPGSTIIHCGENALAAYDPDARQLTVVAVNDAGTRKTLQVDLSAFARSGNKVRVIRTSGSMENGEHWAELDSLQVTDGQFTADMSKNSITTWIVEDVER